MHASGGRHAIFQGLCAGSDNLAPFRAGSSVRIEWHDILRTSHRLRSLPSGCARDRRTLLPELFGLWSPVMTVFPFVVADLAEPGTGPTSDLDTSIPYSCAASSLWTRWNRVRRRRSVPLALLLLYSSAQLFFVLRSGLVLGCCRATICPIYPVLYLGVVRDDCNPVLLLPNSRPHQTRCQCLHFVALAFCGSRSLLHIPEKKMVERARLTEIATGSVFEKQADSVKRLLLYPLAFIIFWIPATLNRYE